jgi:hypothetical protein
VAWGATAGSFAAPLAGSRRHVSDVTAFKPKLPIDALAHSVEFTVAYGGSVTPNWSLIQWKVPGLTVPGVSLTGIRTDILNIARGPADERNRLLLNQTLINPPFRQYAVISVLSGRSTS